jgi:outer membrane protein OmpA-like peptidoglycan-associated protein
VGALGIEMIRFACVAASSCVCILLASCATGDAQTNLETDSTLQEIKVISIAPKPPILPDPILYGADVFFDFDSALLSPEGERNLDRLASLLQGHVVQEFNVTGYTDSIGTPAYNQELSVRRADAVKKYLIRKGFDPEQIETSGRGSSAPILPNTINGKDNPTGRARNRRTEVEVVIGRRR